MISVRKYKRLIKDNFYDFYLSTDVDPLLKELEELRTRFKIDNLSKTRLTDRFQIIENPITDNAQNLISDLTRVYSFEDIDYYLIDWEERRYTWYENGTFMDNKPESDFHANYYFREILSSEYNDGLDHSLDYTR